MSKREPDFVDGYYADKDLDLLQKLTIVIPTYNRNYYLSRCLWYHAHFPFGQIIVADSSPEKKKVVNRYTVSKISEMFGIDILYLEYDQETEKYGGDIYRKWGDAIQHVETEYSQICTDKEFLYPSGLKSHLLFLEKNQEYVACRSHNQYLKSTKNNMIIFRSSRYDSIEGTDSYQRYLRAIHSRRWAMSHLHATMRSDIHKRSYSVLETYNITDLRYGEIVVGYSSHIYGKTKYLFDTYITRDITNLRDKLDKVNMGESSTLRYPCFDEYPPEINNEYYWRYLNSLEKELKLVGNSVNICIIDKDIGIKHINSFNLSINLHGHGDVLKRLGPLFWAMPVVCQKIASPVLKKYFGISPSIGPIKPKLYDEIILRIIHETASEYGEDGVVHYII